MSNTYRKDKHDKKYKEGLKKEKPQYRCNCWHCIGYTTELKHELIDKIAKKEMTEEIRVIETAENIDFDIPEQEDILEQIMGRS